MYVYKDEIILSTVFVFQIQNLEEEEEKKQSKQICTVEIIME